MTENLTPDDELTCQWVFYCDRPAVGLAPHPILGGVPTCEHCANHFDLALTSL